MPWWDVTRKPTNDGKFYVILYTPEKTIVAQFNLERIANKYYDENSDHAIKADSNHPTVIYAKDQVDNHGGSWPYVIYMQGA